MSRKSTNINLDKDYQRAMNIISYLEPTKDVTLDDLLFLLEYLKKCDI
jgi:hypothetical protein